MSLFDDFCAFIGYLQLVLMSKQSEFDDVLHKICRKYEKLTIKILGDIIFFHL